MNCEAPIASRFSASYRPQPRGVFGFAVTGVIEGQPIGVDADDFAEALGSRIEIHVAEETADEARALIVVRVEPREAVAGVPEGLTPEIHVMREERGRRQAHDERNQVRVIRAGCREFPADFPRADAPRSQHGLLFQVKVFVENEHAGSTRVRELCGACGIGRAPGIAEHGARQVHGLGDGFRGDGVRPMGTNFVHSLATVQTGENLPHHDARTFERGLAVADAAVGDDVFAEFDALAGRGGAFGFHGVNVRRDARRVQGGGFFHTQDGCLRVETAGGF